MSAPVARGAHRGDVMDALAPPPPDAAPPEGPLDGLPADPYDPWWCPACGQSQAWGPDEPCIDCWEARDRHERRLVEAHEDRRLVAGRHQ